MGVGFLILILIGLFILSLSPISFFLLRKYGYKKLGILVAVLLAIVVLYPAVLIAFESELYSKSDARKDIAEIGFTLKDDFEIVSNKITGVTDYYQFSKLKISKNDKNKIISNIQNSRDFKIRDITHRTLEDSIRQYQIDVIEANLFLIKNSKVGNKFIREVYKKKKNQVPKKMKMILEEFSDVAEIVIIEDY